MKATCRYTGRAAGDLADGRPVAPGELVKGVDLDEPHNQRLVDDGLLLVIDKPKARRQSATTEKGASS